jgi:hypothetical protein
MKKFMNDGTWLSLGVVGLLAGAASMGAGRGAFNLGGRVTDADIRALKEESAMYGDREMVRLCNLALEAGSPGSASTKARRRAARRECERVILSARSMADD